jgi:hypothetical protein
MSNRLDKLNVKYEEFQAKKDQGKKLEVARVTRDAPAKKLTELKGADFNHSLGEPPGNRN